MKNAGRRQDRMLATICGKGRVTIPKRIRDLLGIHPGTRIDFRIECDGTLRLVAMQRGAAGLFGLLHDAARPAVSIEQMNKALDRQLAADDRRIVRAAQTKR